MKKKDLRWMIVLVIAVAIGMNAKFLLSVGAYTTKRIQHGDVTTFHSVNVKLPPWWWIQAHTSNSVTFGRVPIGGLDKILFLKGDYEDSEDEFWNTLRNFGHDDGIPTTEPIVTGRPSIDGPTGTYDALWAYPSVGFLIYGVGLRFDDSASDADFAKELVLAIEIESK